MPPACAVSSGYQRRGLAPVRIRRSIDPRPSVWRRSRHSFAVAYTTAHLSAGQLPVLSVGFARLIDRAETCRCCSSASGLPLRTCVRSPARRVGGLSSQALERPRGSLGVWWPARCQSGHRGSQALSPTETSAGCGLSCSVSRSSVAWSLEDGPFSPRPTPHYHASFSTLNSPRARNHRR